ncbi:hypothetical protein EK904_009720, partial [Melospiza melodia maxima]
VYRFLLQQVVQVRSRSWKRSEVICIKTRKEMIEERYMRYKDIVTSLQQQLEDSKQRVGQVKFSNLMYQPCRPNDFPHQEALLDGFGYK